MKLDLNCSESENTEGSIEDGVPSLKDLSAEVAAAAANSSKVLIVDARSYPAAVGNRARGGGVECIEYYPFAEIIFMSLGNIHNIRKSFQALRSLCNQTPADFSGGAGWLAALDATKWLYHTSGLLKAATRVASALHTEGRPGMHFTFFLILIIQRQIIEDNFRIKSVLMTLPFFSSCTLFRWLG